MEFTLWWWVGGIAEVGPQGEEVLPAVPPRTITQGAKLHPCV